MLTLIISGGQTGADLGGLYAAEALTIPTGGWMPKGFKTELGPSPWMAKRFDLKEHPSSSYPPRTKANVKWADATVIFGRRSSGSALTESIALELKRPILWLDYPPELLIRSVIPATKMRLWLHNGNYSILNVAGNRESVTPGLQEAVCTFICKILRG